MDGVADRVQNVDSLAGVVFDLDGVLADTERLHLDLTSTSLGVLGHSHDPEELRALVGLRDQECDDWLRRRFGRDFDIRKFLVEYGNLKRAALRDGVPRRPCVPSAVLRLSERFTIGVATGSSRSTALHAIASLGLDSLISCLISGEDVSVGKPDPESYLQAASAMGLLPGQCAAVEDSLPGVQSARAAGFRVYVVPDQVPSTMFDPFGYDHLFPDLGSLATALLACGPEAVDGQRG